MASDHAAMPPALASALEPPTPGWLVRNGRFLPGVARTGEQIERYARYWRELARTALTADGPVLVALGDSLAQGIGASEPERGYVGALRRQLGADDRSPAVLNLSRSGAKIADVVRTQLPALAAVDITTSLVVCTVGSNDLVRSAKVRQTRRDLTELLEQLDRVPARVVVATVPDRASLAAKSLNRHLIAETERLALRRAEVAAGLTTWRGRRAGDGFHPNDDGYGVWVEAFRPHVEASVAGRVGDPRS